MTSAGEPVEHDPRLLEAYEPEYSLRVAFLSKDFSGDSESLESLF